MKYHIHSDKLMAEIDTFGGELHSLKDKAGNEYIWNAGDAWKRHAPLLFPFICNTKSKKYTVQGEKYALSNHGFARDTEFAKESAGSSEVTLYITSDERTKAVYPYDFRLSVTYSLNDSTLTTKMTVQNTGNEDMFFFIGGHPAFNCPFRADKDSRFSDYDVVYEKNETVTQDEYGVTVLENGNKVPVTRALFRNDVFLKDKPQSSKISLVSRKSGRSVTVSYDNSGCIAVWSPNNDKGAFVCLEPWSSAPVYRCDTEELTEMPHAKRLGAGESYDFSFDITIN